MTAEALGRGFAGRSRRQRLENTRRSCGTAAAAAAIEVKEASGGVRGREARLVGALAVLVTLDASGQGVDAAAATAAAAIEDKEARGCVREREVLRADVLAGRCGAS